MAKLIIVCFFFGGGRGLHVVHLTVYWYLSYCLFSETQVFEDVVEILDPEMNIDSETGDDEIQVTLK